MIQDAPYDLQPFKRIFKSACEDSELKVECEQREIWPSSMPPLFSVLVYGSQRGVHAALVLLLPYARSTLM
jgi:hypothetical protein